MARTKLVLFDVSHVQTVRYTLGSEVYILVVTAKIASYRSCNEPIKLKDTPACILDPWIVILVTGRSDMCKPHLYVA